MNHEQASSFRMPDIYFLKLLLNLTDLPNAIVETCFGLYRPAEFALFLFPIGVARILPLYPYIGLDRLIAADVNSMRNPQRPSRLH